MLVLIAACLGLALPPLPKPKHKSAAVHQGAGALALIKLSPPPAVPRTNTFVWQYPPDIVASNLWWNLESSTDLVHWTVEVSNASGQIDVNVNTTDNLKVFRITGRTSP